MSSSRLRDSTAEEYSIQMRQAAITMALVKDSLGEMGARDPEMLDTFCASRKIAAPVRLLVKSAIAAMDTASGLAPSVPMLAAFLGAVDRRSVLGQLGAIRVPSTKVVGATQTGTATSFWVGSKSRSRSPRSRLLPTRWTRVKLWARLLSQKSS